MNYRFILTITEHRYLGWIIVPTLIRQNNASFITIHEQASSFHFHKEGYDFAEEEKEIILQFEKFSEQHLARIFSKGINVSEFYDKLSLERFEERVRPFIEKYLTRILELATLHHIAIYLRRPNYNNLYDADRVHIASFDSKTVFNFTLKDNTIQYNLSVRHKGDVIGLLNKEVRVISNSPCWVCINNTLFHFGDVDAKKLLPFTQKRFVTIPPSAKKKYMESFVLNAIRHNTVVAEGFDIVNQLPAYSAHLIIEEDLNNAPVLSLRFKYGNRYVMRCGKQCADVSFDENEGQYTFMRFDRNWDWEKSKEEALLKLGLEKSCDAFFKPNTYSSDDQTNFYTLVNWLNENEHSLAEEGFKIIQRSKDVDYYIGSIKLSMDMDDAIDWFELYGTVTINDYKIPFIRFKKHILSGNREYTLPHGEVIVLPLEWFTRYQEIFKFSKEKNERIILDKIHFNLLQNSDVRQMDRAELENIYAHKPDMDVPLPTHLNATLRAYQKEGYSWLLHLKKNDFGGCLADDMGLGKTLQALTLLQLIYEKSYRQKKQIAVNSIIDDTLPKEQLSLFDQKLPEESLLDKEENIPASVIVMPKSLLHNWKNEIRKFCPGMLVYTYTGNKRLRSMDIWKIFRHFHVILTSYGVVRNDLEFLKTYKYHYLILDESHFIKNPSSKVYKAVNQLEAAHRIAITGTPIENSLQDLWAQFNFINPGLLGSQTYFRNHFVLPITKHNDEKREKRLQKIITPFILRRTKQEVAKDLPPLTEQVLYCSMTEAQKHMYEKEKSGIRNNLLQNIETSGIDKSRLMALQGLMRLRLLANHPVLADKEYKYDSGKFDRIIRNLGNLKAEKHKVLIFSSFVKHLKIIEDYLKEQEWIYSMLTGATDNRQEVINDFMTDPDNHVFLISLKAGGVGLNLTEADYVFILDPWWNPASEMQAVNRAHRIGQNKQVMVYRFITSDSIEEKISRLQDKKSRLANTFINNNNPFKNLSKKEIDDLFK